MCKDKKWCCFSQSTDNTHLEDGNWEMVISTFYKFRKKTSLFYQNLTFTLYRWRKSSSYQTVNSSKFGEVFVKTTRKHTTEKKHISTLFNPHWLSTFTYCMCSDIFGCVKSAKTACRSSLLGDVCTFAGIGRNHNANRYYILMGMSLVLTIFSHDPKCFWSDDNGRWKQEIIIIKLLQFILRNECRRLHDNTSHACWDMSLKNKNVLFRLVLKSRKKSQMITTHSKVPFVGIMDICRNFHGSTSNRSWDISV